jgi:hypothetical protein
LIFVYSYPGVGVAAVGDALTVGLRRTMRFLGFAACILFADLLARLAALVFFGGFCLLAHQEVIPLGPGLDRRRHPAGLSPRRIRALGRPSFP